MIIISFVVLMQIILIYKGGELFRTSGLTFDEFLVMLMFALSIIPIDFVRKLILKYRGSKLGV
jgi:integral membrane sensor domain MASE1